MRSYGNTHGEEDIKSQVSQKGWSIVKRMSLTGVDSSVRLVQKGRKDSFMTDRLGWEYNSDQLIWRNFVQLQVTS